MANMTFGVNLIPKNSNNTQQTLGNSENKWDIYADNLHVTSINDKTPVTGVKGLNELNYRTGDVNLTPATIGAKRTQTAVSDPTTSGTAVAFIDTISQNSQGVITPTKKSVRIVTETAAGLMSANDKTKLDGIAEGAAVTSVNSKTGAVILGAGDVGAVSKSGDTMAGDLNITKTSAIVSVTDSQKGHTLQLGSWNNGTQGLWSLGYWNGSGYVSSPAWLIARDTTGKIKAENLYIENTGDAIVEVKSSSTNVPIQLASYNTGNQGLWSLGYGNAATGYVSDGQWLIHRDKDGKVVVNNHYNKDEIYNKSEIDARFSNFFILKIERSVSIPTGVSGITTTPIDLTAYIPNGMRIYDAVSVWLNNYRLPYITDDGVVKTWVSTISSNSITIKNLAGDWSNYNLFVTLLIHKQ